MNILNVTGDNIRVRTKQEIIVIEGIYYLKTFTFNMKLNEWQSSHMIKLSEDCMTKMPNVDVSYDLFDMKQ